MGYELHSPKTGNDWRIPRTPRTTLMIIVTMSGWTRIWVIAKILMINPPTWEKIEYHVANVKSSHQTPKRQ
ncbi:7753_t:CDS:2 [Rhizophagus irregularis]|nr:7753_t:CDS:2 [Rhizophagus irregularis]